MWDLSFKNIKRFRDSHLLSPLRLTLAAGGRGDLLRLKGLIRLRGTWRQNKGDQEVTGEFFHADGA